jgi:hypothetical protein
MIADELEKLLEQAECEWLEYKVQAPKGFFDATNPNYQDARSEWLIDLVALANANSEHQKRFLIFGVQDNQSERVVVGIQEKCDDATLQDFAKDKFDPPIEFSYQTVLAQGKQVGIFEIRAAKRDELHFAKVYVGSSKKRILAAGQLWIRRGTQTQIAQRQDLKAALSPLAPILNQTRGKNVSDSKNLLLHYNRIRDLFNWHNIPDVVAAQILKDFGVTFPIFLDPYLLLERVNYKMLEFLSGHFDVLLDYLLLKSTTPNEFRDNYRVGAGWLCRKIVQYQQSGLLKFVHFVRVQGAKFPSIPQNSVSDDVYNQVSIVLELSRGVDNIAYSTFEDQGVSPWNYQKSRLGFKAVLWFVMQLSAARVIEQFYFGNTIRPDAMKAYIKGDMHVSEMLVHHDAIHDWHPDDEVDGKPENAAQKQEWELLLERIKQERIDQILAEVIS